MLNRSLFAKFVTYVLPAVLLGGCSGPSEDVRLTLCRDLTQELLPAAQDVTWNGHQAVMKGYEDLQMRVNYQLADGTAGEAICFYAYEQEYAEAQTLADPSSAYATNPHRAVIGGESLTGRRLAELVARVMMKQGREAVERVMEEVKKLPKHPQPTTESQAL